MGKGLIRRIDIIIHKVSKTLNTLLFVLPNQILGNSKPEHDEAFILPFQNKLGLVNKFLGTKNGRFCKIKMEYLKNYTCNECEKRRIAWPIQMGRGANF